MHKQTGAMALTAMAFCVLLNVSAAAQSPANMIVLRGLAPFAALPHLPAGQAALAANFAVTGAIQAGLLQPSPLQPFAAQQQDAIQDAFITNGNARQLSDGLGTRLGTIYQAQARYGTPREFSNISPALANLFAYTNETTALDSNSGKFFFANQTLDGTALVSAAAAAILPAQPGGTDVFGKAYGRPAGSPGADLYGNSRPFQTEPVVAAATGVDYFGRPAQSLAFLRGPAQDLTNSPSFPSGHTTYGTAQAVLLAILVPQRYGQALTRGAEYGNARIVLGAHYAMDVIAGRTVALHDLAQLLAHNPAYVGQPRRTATIITDYRAAVKQAQMDMAAALQAGCGDTLPVCAATDSGRFANPAANAAFYAATLGYGLPVVYPDIAAKTEDVGAVAPEAGYLLTAAFPYLTLAQADTILTATQGPGGGFLNDGSAFGLYSRLNLYAAGLQAAALAPPQP